MLSRNALPTLLRLAGWFPIVALTGPRQSGKTTLAQAAFPDKAYVSLEDPDWREFVENDPRAFLAQYVDGAIIDEAQRVPALFSYLQSAVDADNRPGRFILTGSQQFGLMSGITQSLAGRVGSVTLLPFSFEEMQAGRPSASLEELLWKGMYPPIHDRDIPPNIWSRDYVATYVERDARQLINVRDLSTFQRFVRMCASRSGQLLNLSALAADCGITHNTAKAWISVLEASYLVHMLRPYHQNFGKRLVKTPKLYFWDTGLACWLMGIHDPETLVTHPARGGLFETWVTSEFFKAAYNAALPGDFFFWRDSAGHEIDLLIDRDNHLTAVEMKSGQTIASDWFDGIKRFNALSRSDKGWLIYGGDLEQERTGISVRPWQQIGQCTRELVQ